MNELTEIERQAAKGYQQQWDDCYFFRFGVLIALGENPYPWVIHGDPLSDEQLRRLRAEQ